MESAAGKLFVRCTSADRLLRPGSQGPGLWREEVSQKAVPLDRRRVPGRRTVWILEEGADLGDQGHKHQGMPWEPSRFYQ